MEETIIDRLIKARTSLGLNQGNFAKKIGLSQAAVSDFENYKKSLIDRNIKVICLTFGINEAWLRTGDGEMFVSKATIPAMDDLLDEDGNELPPDVKELIGIYRDLIPENKKFMQENAKMILATQEATKKALEKHPNVAENGKSA